MDQLENETICEPDLNDFDDSDISGGGGGQHSSQDNYFICLFCSKHCYNSTNLHNLDNPDLKRVFHSLQINTTNDKIFRRPDNSALITCQNCYTVINKLSTLFKDLEVTKLWINHLLRNLMNIIISGEDDESVQDDYEKVVLRELIMEKCISTVKATSLPQLKLNRCQLPGNEQETQFIDEDDQLSTTSSLNTLVKLEDVKNVQFLEKDNGSPTSPIITSKQAITSKKKSKPFWFVHPTIKISPSSGLKSTKFSCPFCPRFFHGMTAIKFHSISSHPEHIFSNYKSPDLNFPQFRATCIAILEQEVVAISNEDGIGSFTTFQCKYCPDTSKHKNSSSKKVIQKHLITNHYNKLVESLEILQRGHGTREFDDKVANYLGKIGCTEFRRKWKCGRCECGFPNVKRLEWHKKTCDGTSGGKGKQVKGQGGGGNNEATSTVPKKSPCETCGKIFSCGYSLWRHKRLSCLKNLRNGKEIKQNVGEFGQDEIIQEEMEREILPEVNQEDPLLFSTELLPLSPEPPPQLDQIVKLEDIEITFLEESEQTLPSSPPPPPPSIYFCSEDVQMSPSPVVPNFHRAPSTSRRPTLETGGESEATPQNPFWFVKPTRAQAGVKRAKYFCLFCPKSFNGSNSLKFHSINHHPEHIFSGRNIYELTEDQFRACCSTILEEEVTPISNEDGVGSYTTFQCKYCPITAKSAAHCDKRVIQKHLIGDHYDVLVGQLQRLQYLQGTKEFEDRVGIHLGKKVNCRKVLSNMFKRKWKCDGCGCGFPNVNRLERHVLTCEAVVGGEGGKKDNWIQET